MELEIGDIVKLKSGGPEMTVLDFPISSVALVMYFDVKFKGHDAHVPAAALHKKDENGVFT